MRAKKVLFYLLMPAIITCAGAYGIFIEPYNIEVHELKMGGSVLGQTLKGMTAVHISDLHMGNKGATEKEILRIIEDINPDFLFLTGDYVTWDGDYEAALDFLSRLKARLGVWAVMGDYDYSNSRKSCLFCHEQGTGNRTRRHEVRFLRNSSEVVGIGDSSVQVYGIDNTDSEEDDRIEVREPTIVLSHSPLKFDIVENNSEVLMLSGDTHGGQVPLPGWFWRVIGYEKNAKYNCGLYKDGQKMMYVSRGIGTSHIPFRLFRRPEIVVIRF